MRHLLGSLFAIGVASIAAIAATTALLNAPVRVGPAAATTAGTTAPPGAPLAPDAPPGTTEAGKPATPGGTPDAAKPASSTTSGAGATAGEKPEEDDQDPYEGIAPEELPPDLQYSADSSVSFPTNI